MCAIVYLCGMCVGVPRCSLYLSLVTGGHSGEGPGCYSGEGPGEL